MSCPQPRGAGVNCCQPAAQGGGSAPRPQGRRDVQEPPARQSARRARPGNGAPRDHGSELGDPRTPIPSGRGKCGRGAAAEAASAEAGGSAGRGLS